MVMEIHALTKGHVTPILTPPVNTHQGVSYEIRSRQSYCNHRRQQRDW